MESISAADIYAVGIPVIIALIFFEALFSARKSLQLYNRADTNGTVGMLAGNILMGLAIQGLVLGFYFYLYQFRLFTINEALPLWAVWLATAVAIDFIFYWYHRSSHRIRFLWAVHMNHHSSTEMNFSVAFRQAWFGPVTKTPFFMLMPLAGFDPSITAVCAVALRLYGVFGHTQWIDKLGWLDAVFSTPTNHRVHHGSNPEYIDKNYGNFLIIWDRLFGTFAREKGPVTFGLVNNLGTNNPIKITFHLWGAMARDLRQARSVKEAIGYIAGPPDWKAKR